MNPFRPAVTPHVAVATVDADRPTTCVQDPLAVRPLGPAASRMSASYSIHA